MVTTSTKKNVLFMFNINVSWRKVPHVFFSVGDLLLVFFSISATVVPSYEYLTRLYYFLAAYMEFMRHHFYYSHHSTDRTTLVDSEMLFSV